VRAHVQDDSTPATLRSRATEDPLLLFLHLPKTAGTSVTGLLYTEFERRFPDDSAVVGDLRDGRFNLSHGVLYLKENESAGFHRDRYESLLSDADVDVLRRSDVHAIIGHFTFGIHRYIERPTTYVTFLRDPIDRVISLYFHLLEYPDDYPLNARVASNRMGIADFVDELSCPEADNEQVRRLSGLDAPFGECTREMLQQAKQNLVERFALVGLTERFVESVVLLRRRLGWDPLVYLPRRLVNAQNPGRGSLTKAELAIIARRNELDVELYEFGRLLFDRHIACEGWGFHSELEAIEAAGERRVTDGL
jgi:hypothetical protein